MSKIKSLWLMRGIVGAILSCTALATIGDEASDPVVEPNAQLKAQGMPALRQSVVNAVQPYADFRGFGFVDWHPKRQEMLVRHRAPGADTTQLFRLRTPGGQIGRAHV